MKRPLFTGLLFLCLGIVVAKFFPEFWLVFFALTLFLGAAVFFSSKSKLALALPILFLTGSFTLQNSIGVHNHIIDAHVQTGRIFSVTGQVRSYNFTRTGRQSLVINTRNLYVNGEIIYDNFLIQALLPLEEEAKVGQYIVLTGRLNPLSTPNFPGGFNQFQFLRARGIEYTMFPTDIYYGEENFTIRGILQNARRRMLSVFEQNLPPSQAAIMQSMILGDRSNLDNDLLDAYRAAGIYHILIVSGLHISILALALNKFLDRFFLVKTAALITLGLIIPYGVMVSGVSVTRAVTMAGVMIFAKVLYRQRDFITTISFAALCLLLYEPLFLFDVGFLLSFGAVYGIALGAEPMERFLNIVLRPLPLAKNLLKYKSFIQGLSVTIAVPLFIDPILAYFFFYFMPYGVLGNIAVILSGKFLITMGFLVAFVGVFIPPLALFLSGGLYFIVSFYEIMVRFFYNLPHSMILVGRPHLISLAIYYTALYFLCNIFKHSKPKSSDIRYFSLAAACLAVFLVYSGLQSNLRVTFLDVGQGESIVVSHNNQHYVIDGGGLRGRELGNNTGARVLIPYLRYRGISSVDAIFLTHEDADHMVGIIELLDYSRKNINIVYTTIGFNKTAPLAEIFLERISERDVALHFIHAPAVFTQGDLQFEILHPVENTHFRNPNAGSLVIRLVYDNIAFLFTGDIDQHTEREILSRSPVQAHVLNVAHHGSRFSSYERFIAAVNPTVAVISAGNNNFGHPSPDVMNLLERKNIPAYVTKFSGTIIITTDGERIFVEETG